MSGICGWIGTDDGGRGLGAIIDSMAAALPAFGELRQEVACAPKAALAMRAHPTVGDWYHSEDLWASLEGYPVWRDAALESVANDQGHAAALALAYRRQGENLFDKLFGHFAFAVVEPQAARALIAIDRFGIQTLCYSHTLPDRLVFGSTTDTVRAFPGIGSTIAPQTLYNFLYFIDRVCAPETIYTEQRKLLPGEYLRFEAGALERQRYWRMAYRPDRKADKTTLSAGLVDHLRQAIGRCLRAEDPSRLASFLSGGLDSSTVAKLFAEACPGKARTVTIGFDLKEFDESPYAELAAKAFGTLHETHRLQPAHVLEAMPSIITIYDEPFSNSSAVPCYYCALKGWEAGAEVMLAGDGGDEIFSGNTRYLEDDVFDHYHRLPDWFKETVLEPMVARLPLKGHVSLFRKASNYIETAKTPVPVRLTSRNVYRTADPREIFTAEAWAEIDPLAPLRFVEEIYEDAEGGTKLQKMMQMDLRITLADSDLRKVSRMCELAGVRVRYPLLDDALVMFSATIPPEILNEGGRIRQFYKDVLKSILPKAIIEKPKQGFGLPHFEFIRDHPPLMDFFCDALADLKRRLYFKATFLDRVITLARSGDTACHCGVVWDLAVLEHWMQSRALRP
jgi:asparagine synthase (glutamine-hydrolysing)